MHVCVWESITDNAGNLMKIVGGSTDMLESPGKSLPHPGKSLNICNSGGRCRTFELLQTTVENLKSPAKHKTPWRESGDCEETQGMCGKIAEDAGKWRKHRKHAGNLTELLENHGEFVETR